MIQQPKPKQSRMNHWVWKARPWTTPTKNLSEIDVHPALPPATRSSPFKNDQIKHWRVQKKKQSNKYEVLMPRIAARCLSRQCASRSMCRRKPQCGIRTWWIAWTIDGWSDCLLCMDMWWQPRLEYSGHFLEHLLCYMNICGNFKHVRFSFNDSVRWGCNWESCIKLLNISDIKGTWVDQTCVDWCGLLLCAFSYVFLEKQWRKNLEGPGLYFRHGSQ